MKNKKWKIAKLNGKDCVWFNEGKRWVRIAVLEYDGQFAMVLACQKTRTYLMRGLKFK